MIEGQPGCQWGAILTLEFPVGTTRHPRVSDVVEQELGRYCVVDRGHEGVRVSYGVNGDSPEDAQADSLTVAATLLTILDLSEEAIVRHTIRPEDDLGNARAGPHLFLLPTMEDDQ